MRTEPPGSRRELLAIHKHVVPDQQRVLHRTGRNLERLHDEGDDEQAGHQHGRQRRKKLDCGFARFFRLRIFFLGH